jgi:hypothetical protein
MFRQADPANRNQHLAFPTVTDASIGDWLWNLFT